MITIFLLLLDCIYPQQLCCRMWWKSMYENFLQVREFSQHRLCINWSRFCLKGHHLSTRELFDTMLGKVSCNLPPCFVTHQQWHLFSISCALLMNTRFPHFLDISINVSHIVCWVGFFSCSWPTSCCLCVVRPDCPFRFLGFATCKCLELSSLSFQKSWFRWQDTCDDSLAGIMTYKV